LEDAVRSAFNFLQKKKEVWMVYTAI
jgi:hypothetical protein